MRRNFSSITLYKNIQLLKDITFKSTSKSLGEFPIRKIHIIKSDKKEIPSLDKISSPSDFKHSYVSHMKPSKIAMRESINYFNEERTNKSKGIEKSTKIQLLRDELNQIDSMIHERYNRNVILYERKSRSQLRKL